MTIELTGPQQKVLDMEGSALKVVDPRTNARYALVPMADFETFQAVLDDDRQQRAIRRIGLRNAAARAECEP